MCNLHTGSSTGFHFPDSQYFCHPLDPAGIPGKNGILNCLQLVSYLGVYANLPPVWHPHCADCVYLKVRLCAAEGAVKCTGGLAAQWAALWTIVLLFILLQSGWRWTNLKSPRLESWANTFLEAPGGGFVLWTRFFFWPFFPPVGIWEPF